MNRVKIALAILIGLMAFSGQTRAEETNSANIFLGSAECEAGLVDVKLVTIGGLRNKGQISIEFGEGAAKVELIGVVHKQTGSINFTVSNVTQRLGPQLPAFAELTGSKGDASIDLSGLKPVCEDMRLAQLSGIEKQRKDASLAEQGKLAKTGNAQEKVASIVAKCAAAKDALAKDCLVSAAYVTIDGVHSVDGSVDLKAKVDRACGKAALSLSPDDFAECIIGSEQLRGNTITDLGGPLAGARAFEFSCPFAVEVLKRYGVDASEAGSAPTACRNFIELLTTRGLKFSPEHCGGGNARWVEVAICAGGDPSSKQFAEIWRAAIDDCARGGREGFDSATETAKRNGFSAKSSHQIDCPDAADVSVRFGIVSPDVAKIAVVADKRLRGRRPPRAGEIEVAVEERIRTYLVCNSRSEACRVSLPDQSNDAAVDAVMGMSNALAQGIGQGAGVSMNGSSIQDLEVYLTLRDVSADLCVPTQDESVYNCQITVSIECSVIGPVIFNGVDLYRTTLEAQICPAYTVPDRLISVGWRNGQVMVSN